MKLEICIDRVESALAAKSGGADRIEVCGALDVGGITPSYGLVEQCVAIGGIEVSTMIRPHAGGFCYGPEDVGTMVRDILAAKTLGVQGVVIGGLHQDGRIDRGVCQRLMEAARPLAITFHRAFDLTPDPLEALDTLRELGVDRLLTSGQAASAMEGAKLIRELVMRAGNELAVMAGAGLRPENVAAMVRATGVREVHASASESDTIETSNTIEFVQSTRITRQETVRAMFNALREIDSQ